MTADEIDNEIDKLAPDEIDALVALSYADKRCKAEIALAGAALFIALVCCIIHISCYVGDFHPPMLHRVFLLCAGIVAPYVMVKAYEDMNAWVVVRASRRVYVRGNAMNRGS
jgi:hypothetical protein